LAAASGDPAIETIISTVSASHSQIVKWHNELKPFVAALCHANLECRGREQLVESCHPTIAAEIAESLASEGLFSLAPQTFVDYKFGDHAPADAVESATERLEQMCLDLVNELFALLTRLQKQKMVGWVEYTDNTCRLTFFRRVAILEEIEGRTSQVGFGSRTESNEGRITDRVENVRHWTREIQHRDAVHVHHVHQPVVRQIEEAEYPIPLKYQRLAATVPDWIRPSLRVLEGDMFREQQIEKDSKKETQHHKEYFIEEVSWQSEPAILFADFVLAGWGEKEIEEEKSRLRSQAPPPKVSLPTLAKRYHAASISTAVLAVAATVGSYWSSLPMTLLAIVLGVGVLYLASRAAHFLLLARQKLTVSRVLSHTALVGGTTLLVQSVLYSILHQSLPALLPAALGGVAAFIGNGLQDMDKESGVSFVD